MCVGMYVDMSVNMCVDMCLDMHVYMCSGMYLNMYIDMCIHMCLDICLELCKEMPVGFLYRPPRTQVCRHTSAHTSMHILAAPEPLFPTLCIHIFIEI